MTREGLSCHIMKGERNEDKLTKRNIQRDGDGESSLPLQNGLSLQYLESAQEFFMTQLPQTAKNSYCNCSKVS